MAKYSVLICDDEVLICELIRNIVDWEALGLEVIGTVHNGIQALERIRDEKPDIAIMDIRVPGLNGLEVIERANASSPETRFIIVSGYQNFEYAQKSIRYNVYDYILKPIMAENLTNALNRVIGSLSQQSEDDRLKHYSRETALRSIFTSPDYTEKNIEYISQLFKFYPGLFQTVALRDIDGVTESRASLSSDLEQTENLVWNKVSEVFTMILGDKCYSIQRYVNDNTIYFILNYSPDSSPLIASQWRSLLAAIDAYIQNYTVVIGRSVNALSQVGISLRDCANGLKAHMALGNRKMIFVDGDDFPEMPASLKDSPHWRELEKAIVACDIDKSLQALQALIRFEGVLVYQYPLIYSQTVDMAFGILTNTVSRFNLNEEVYMDLIAALSARRQAAQRRLDCLSDVGQWQEMFLSEFSYMFEMCLERLVQSGGRQIQEVKQYIQAHLGEKLSLNVLAEYMHMNPVYFSAWFKQHSGTGFSEYLQTARIERAKQLLTDRDLSIDLIAELVGLNSTSYFRKTFKQEVGISPTQYRKYYG